MFERLKNAFSTKYLNPSASPRVELWSPLIKIDSALDAALRLFTQALNQAGKDSGGLAVNGPAPVDVASLLAESVIYPGQNGTEFLTLALLHSKGYSSPPHFRLFTIINAALLLEKLPDSPLRSDCAVGQVPRPFIDAHMMKIWIKYIQPTGDALAKQDEASLEAVLRALASETIGLGRLVPKWMLQRIDIDECTREWRSGFPGTVGQPLTADVKRINQLPVTEFVGKQITDFMVELQVQGVREQNARSFSSSAGSRS